MPRSISVVLSVAVLGLAAYLAWRLATAGDGPRLEPAGGPESRPAAEPAAGAPASRVGTASPIEGPTPRSEDRIEGTVFDEAGAPVADAEVQIIHYEFMAESTRPPDRRFEERVLASTASDAAGRYAFAGLPAGEARNLRATRPGFVTQLKDNVRVPATVDFHLASGAVVRGKVVSSTTGAPIEGVGVKGWFQTPKGPTAARAFRWKEEVPTNRDGEFGFEAVPPGEVRFMLAHPEYVDRTEDRTVVLQGLNDLLLRMDPGLTIEGIVLSKKGTPVQGADVAVKDNLFLVRWRAKTNPAGVFRMVGVKPGPLLFEIAGRGIAPARQAVEIGPVHDFAGGKRGNRLEFRVDPAGRAAGRVLTHKGEPVAGARIFVAPVAGIFQIVRDPAQHGGSARDGETRTDAEGKFLVDDLTAIPHRLICEAPGYGLAATEGFAVGPEEIRDDLEIVLRPALGIRGTVTGPNKVPVEGAVITVEIPQFPEVLFPPGSELGQKARRETISDRSGLYRVEVPYGGTFTVRVDHKDYVLVENVPVVVKEDVGDTIHDVSLEGGFVISGRVTGPSGAPEPGALVRAWPAPTTGVQFETLSDASGVYTLSRLRPGLYRMQARKSDPSLVSEFRDEVPGGARDVDFRLATAGEVAGAVAAPGGGPVRRFLVILRPVGARPAGAGREPKGSTAGLVTREEQIDDDSGSFRIANVEPSRWSVQVVSGEHAPATPLEVDVRPGATTSLGTIVLEPGGVVRGRMLGPGGRPADGVTIHVNRLRDLAEEPRGPVVPASSRTVRTSATGDYEVGGLLAGQYVMLVESDRFVDPPREQFAVRAGGVVERSFTLKATASVAFAVKDEVGAPAPSVVVWVLGSDGRRIPYQGTGPGSGSTDQHGRMTLRKLPAGEPLTFRLIRPGFQVTQVGRTLAEGENPEIEAEVRRLL
jgi:protocatechuate 3,4-dioxygenase beta subunit